MMRRPQQNPNHQHQLLYELSTLILNILRSPSNTVTPFEFSDHRNPVPAAAAAASQQITPAGFASLLLGISMSLMLCGSVTFFIGFFMMPWVLVFVIVLYLAGIVSTVSMIGRAILWPLPSPPTKDFQQIWLERVGQE